MKINFIWKQVSLLIGFLTLTILPGCTTTYAQQANSQQFIQKMVTQHGFDETQLNSMFSQIKENPKVIKQITTPHESLPWYKYRTIFLTQQRAQEGAVFWQQHAKTLAYAEQHYGVPAPIIVAILGVETRYGTHTGNYNTLDALSTLAFNYPPRAQFFQSQLEQFLLLSRDVPFDPLSISGSYAGALGAPQFMPSSYRRYAVAYNNTGLGDLFHNTDDAIVSIANYFQGYGWQTGGAIARPANKFSQDKAAKLLTLQDAQGEEYWLTYHNFSVIMDYNSSPLYAMSVYQLSEMIKADYRKL